MPKRKIRFAWQWLSALVCALSSTTAEAGPVELLDGMSINPADPDNLVVTYTEGGGGVFVSEDGGVTLKWLCAAGATSIRSNTDYATYASGDGSIYMGSYNGLMRGEKNGCGFQPAPGLEKRYIRAISGDPFDQKRTYAVTSDAKLDNGIYVNDGSGAFTQLGTHAPMFIITLHVVKNGEARRFYETGVVSNIETNSVTYSVRVSDDDGTTWTEHVFDPVPFETTEKRVKEFKIAAIDPTNPDRVVALLLRPDKAPSSLLFSGEQGRAGTWESIATPVTPGAVAFAPDGVLYFGDDNFASKGLFKVEQLGQQPQLLSDAHRISCLGYDQARSRLLGCADNYRFGTLDTSSGELTTMLDLRCAEHAVQCPDQPETTAICQPPSAAFCKVDHWVLAPLCCVYERDEFDFFASSQDIYCESGIAKQKPPAAGEGGRPATPGVCPKPMAGAGGAAAGSGGMAAAVAGSAAGHSGSAAGSGVGGQAGCGCSSAVGVAPGRAATLAWLGLIVLWARRRFRRRAAHSGTTCFLP